MKYPHFTFTLLESEIIVITAHNDAAKAILPESSEDTIAGHEALLTRITDAQGYFLVDFIGDGEDVLVTPAEARLLMLECIEIEKGIVTRKENGSVIAEGAQGNNQGDGPTDRLTERETMLSEALRNVLVKAGMIRSDAIMSPPELLMAADTYCQG